MKKIVILVLFLLLLPFISNAVDEVSFDADTSLEVGARTVTILGGSVVDAMVVGDTSVAFTLSAGSSLIIRSNDRYTLSSNLGFDMLCGTSYSQMTIDNSKGSSLILTVDAVCSGTTGGGAAPSGGGTPTPTPTTPTTPTTSTGEVTVTVSGGGQTTLTTDESTTAAVSLPADAVSASTDVVITTESQETVIASRPTPSSRSIVGSYVYNFTATSGGQAVSSFQKTLTLTFTYTDAQISGLNESNLRVFYWKELTSQWVALPTTINVDTNTLIAETDHFTYFVIMGLAEGVGEEEDLVEEEPETVAIVDGDLIRNPNAAGMAQFDIYIVKLINNKKFKRLILSPHVFESYEHFDKNGDGSPWDDVMDVNQTTVDAYTVSDLVRAVGDTKVYKLVATGDTGTKQWLNMSASAFVSDGYDSDSIYEINATDRNAYITGADLTSGDSSDTSGDTIIIKVSELRVRSLPSLDGDALTMVQQGEVYDLLDEDGGWYKITANGFTGWCYGGDTGGYAAKQ